MKIMTKVLMMLSLHSCGNFTFSDLKNTPNCDISPRSTYFKAREKCEAISLNMDTIKSCIEYYPSEYLKLSDSCKQVEKNKIIKHMDNALNQMMMRIPLLSADTFALNNLQEQTKLLKIWFDAVLKIEKDQSQVEKLLYSNVSKVNAVITKYAKDRKNKDYTSKEDYTTLTANIYQTIFKEQTLISSAIPMVFLNKYLEALDEKVSTFFYVSELGCQFGKCKNTVGETVSKSILRLAKPEIARTTFNPTQVEETINTAYTSYFLKDFKKLVNYDYEKFKGSHKFISALTTDFHKLMIRSEERVELFAAYQKNGLYYKPLTYTLSNANIVNINQFLLDNINNLNAKISIHAGNREKNLDTVINEVENLNEAKYLSLEREKISFELLDNIAKLDDLKKSMSDSKERFSKYLAQIDQYKSSENKPFFSKKKFDLEETNVFSINDHGKFRLDASQPISDLFAEANDLQNERAEIAFNGISDEIRLINVEIAGEWSPNCALSQNNVNANVNVEALIGPEGYFYSHATNNSEITSKDKSNNYTRRQGYQVTNSLCHSTSISGHAGVSSPYGGAKVESSLTASTCASHTFGEDHSTSYTQSETSAATNSTDARFVGGIRLQQTPFNQLPAGSLIAVISNKENHNIEDLIVGQRNFTYKLSNNQKINFIVNDCEKNSANARKLQIKYNMLVSENEKAKKYFPLMLAEIEKISKSVSNNERVGTLSGEYLQKIRTAALSRLPDIQGVPVLLSLFNTWIDEEIEILTAKEKIKSLENDIKVKELTLQQLSGQNTVNEVKQRMVDARKIELLTSLHMNDLPLALKDTVEKVSNKLIPTVKILYKDILNEPVIVDAVTKLNDLSYQSDIEVVAIGVNNLLQAIKLSITEFNFNLDNENASFDLVIKLPRPGNRLSNNFLNFDEVKTTNFWNSLTIPNAKNEVDFEISMNDLYRRGVLNGMIPCGVHSPVISRFMVAASILQNETLTEPFINNLNIRLGNTPFTFGQSGKLTTETGEVLSLEFNEKYTNQVSIGFVPFGNEEFGIDQLIEKRLPGEPKSMEGYPVFTSYKFTDKDSLLNALASKNITLKDIDAFYLLIKVDAKLQRVGLTSNFLGIGNCLK